MKKLFLLGAIAASGIQSAQAVEMKAGDWTVNVGGIVNAYYTHVNCDGGAVGGLALAGGVPTAPGALGLGCGNSNGRTTIGNGLLPSGLITSVKTQEGGYDIGGTIGIMVHTATDSAVAANSGVDVRQGFVTIGNDQMGKVKLGRDYGIFGSNAILSDMTLLGVGSPNQATQRGRVTLGHIGAGYTYLGTYGQIAYSAPKINGIGIDAALVSPTTDNRAFTTGNGPQFQAQLSIAPVEGAKAWAGAKTQKFKAVAGSGANDFTMSGFEIGGSYAIGPFGVLANIQTGKGLGILSDGDQGNVKQRNYFLQGTYKATDKVKVGLNYGQSKNRDNVAETGGLEKNSNVTAGVYYSLTKSVTIAGEIGQTRSKGFNNATDKMKGASVGAIFFF